MKTKHKSHEDEGTEPADVNTAPVEERKPATEPWSAENAPDSPRKKGLLGVAKSKPGHILRWVRFDSVDRRKYLGYELATPAEFDATPDENGMIRRNELVLMTVPADVYHQRRSDGSRATAAQTRAPKKQFLHERAAVSREVGHDLSDEDRDRE